MSEVSRAITVKPSDAPATQDSVPSLPSWQLFALAGLVGATLVVLVSRGKSPAAIILLSLVVFAAAAVGAAALRMLRPFIGGHDSLAVPVAGGRARAAVEREKTLVLRSIKELEFDHAMGKVSNQDFADMGLRLRTRAAGLMRQLDAGATYSTQIEQELARRLAAAGMEVAARAETPAQPEVTSRVEVPAREHRFCTQCGAPTAAAARFCGQCGHRLETA